MDNNLTVTIDVDAKPALDTVEMLAVLQAVHAWREAEEQRAFPHELRERVAALVSRIPEVEIVSSIDSDAASRTTSLS